MSNKKNNQDLKTKQTSAAVSAYLFKNPMPYILILVFVFLLFLQTLKFDIVSLDDDILIKENHHLITHIQSIPLAFKTDVFFSSKGIYYRPLINVSYIIDTLFENSYFNIYHFTNVLLHSIVCCLVFYLLTFLKIDRNLSLLIVLAFASHPIMAFSVSWIGSRNDLLKAMFFVLSVIFLIKYLRSKSAGYLVVHVLSYSLALFCKETSIIYPFIYAIFIKYVAHKKLISKDNVLLVLLWLVCIILFLVLRSFVAIENNEQNVYMSNFIFNFAAFPEFFKNIFLPFYLRPFPFFNQISVVIGLVFLSGAFGIITHQIARNRKRLDNAGNDQLTLLAITGLLMFILVILPSTFIKVGGGVFFDYLHHRAYLPMIGIVIFGSSSIQYYFGNKFQNRLFNIAGIIIILTSSILTFNLSSIFSDPVSFYNYSSKMSPNSAMEWYNKGTVQDKLNHYNEAIDCYGRAIEIKPDYFEAWNNSGLVMYKIGKYDEAMKCYNKALSIKANYAEALYNKGILLNQTGKYSEAVDCYNKAIDVRPFFSDAWNNRGLALYNSFQFDEAFNCFNRAIEIKPNFSEAWNNIGVVLSKSGRNDEAIYSYDKAIENRPDYAEAWFNKAVVLSKSGKANDAVACYDKAIVVKPDYAEAWNNKGAVLMKAGRNDEAVSCFDQAIEIKPYYAEAWKNKGRVMEKLSLPDEAIICYDKVISLNPNDYDAWNSKGISYCKTGKIKESLALFDKAKEIKPDYSFAWQNKGNALSLLGRKSEADECYRKADALSKSDSSK